MSDETSGRVTILLVDDRPENLVALVAILDQPSYRLIRATSGEEALSLALRLDVDVILLDVMMPGMDGFEVATHLKQLERTRRIPILFLTAFETEAQKVYQAYAVGAVDYMVKPLDPEMVRRKVAVFVELVRQRKEIERQAQLLHDAQRREFDLQLAQMRLASDNRYRKLIEGIDHAIGWSAGPDLHQMTFVSRQADQILGYPLDAFMAPGFWIEHVHADDREKLLAACRRTVEEQADQICDHRMLAADGQVLWFHTGVSVEESIEGGPELHGISVDVTALQNALAAAEKATGMRDELLAIVSHDLRNPLGVIVAGANALRGDIGASPDGVRKVEMILRSAERMAALIGDLLDFGQLEAGGLALEPQSMDAGDLIRQTLEFLAPLAASKSLRVEVVGHPELRVSCDPQRAGQILSNLLGNAIKFTPHGGSVALTAGMKDREALFAISDTGPGIAREELPYVFDRYWQGRSGDESGTGLGLSIARRLVEAHGGCIWVESQVKEGTTFFFTLPVAA